jgi:type 2 lantibiotic biosynthesis protein LanM
MSETRIAPGSRSATGNRLDDDDLVAIVERGSWMFERIGEAFVEAPAPDADRLRARRLADWKTIIAAGDDVRFRRRLEWDGLSEADVRKALGPVRLADRTRLPSWARLLAELCGDADAAGPASTRCFDRDLPIPFEHIMAPLVAAASRRMAARCGAALDLFDEPALGALERSLLRRLSFWMTETLHVDFGLFRRARISSLDLMFLRGSAERTTEVYDELVEYMASGGLRTLLLEYPAMARLVATGAESWIDATAELIERFAADRGEIARRAGTALPRVTAIEALLSDSHNRGRSVSILTLSPGGRLVYKPRPVAPEAAWFRLLAWGNAHGLPEELKRLDVIERPHHGWVEVVAASPLGSAEEAARFYRRAGVLLALTYAVGSNDMHFENLIAVGDQPVLIDMETVLCHSPIETVYGAVADDLLRTVFFESPIRTGLLPRWQTGEGIPVDVSGLGAVSGQKSRIPVPRWKDVNTDLMELAYETVQGHPGPNAPRLGGEVLSPNDYLAEIADGFAATLRWLIAERDRMLAPGGPLHALAELRVRFIFRATAQYLMIMKGSRVPHLLRDGADRSIHLEPIAAPLLFAEQRPLGWPLVALERGAMEIEDCPYFTAEARSASIDDPRGGALPGILAAACFDQMEDRLRRLSETDLDNQLGLVRASFDSRTELAGHAGAIGAGVPEASEGAEPLPSSELIEEAVRVADSVLARSIPASGAPHWVTLRYLVAIEKNQLDPVGADLFEGRAGIALLLAALYRATGLQRFGDAARAVAGALRGELALMSPGLNHDLLVHGFTGIVSLAYVFPHLAELLDDPRLVADGARAARFIHPESIAADRRYDLLSGTAGSLMALLRLALAGDGAALASALECGDHLLARRSVSDGGLGFWRTFEERPISGFAHGNAGIAFALLRLSAASGEPRFRAAAQEAIAFENTTFVAAEGNWPDLRWEQPSFAAGWCHGGPGIALSRLEALAYDASLAPDVDCAAALAERHVHEGTDHLCCGNFGRILLLHEIGRGTHRPELVRAAGSLAAGRVLAARRRGGYRLLREGSGHVSFPGLFQGTSGIAYSLLQLALPGRFPDVLRFL